MNKNSSKRSFQKLYKRIRGIVKRNKFIFSLHRHITDKDYKRQKKLMKTCTLKTREQIKKEMNIYSKYWQCPPDDYIRYGLFNKSLSIDEILDYVPMQYYYCDYQDKMVGDIIKLSDKWEEYKLFKEKGIPQPEVIALVEDGQLFSFSENDDSLRKMNWDNLKDLIKESEKIFIKPVNGNCGTGICVIKKVNGQIYLREKVIQQFSQIPIQSHLKYIIQRGLIQRSDLNSINESSLNTLRTIVKYVDNEAVIIAILLRIGRKGSDVDNSGQGGISIEVNLKDGSLSEFAGREHGGNVFYRHPDTGFIFKGTKLKNWDKVLEQIKNIVSKIDGFRTIGWDIAICEDKVYAIEINFGWGIEHAQTIAGGFRRRMGIFPNI